MTLCAIPDAMEKPIGSVLWHNTRGPNLSVLKKVKFAPAQVSEVAKKQLWLPFMPEVWQSTLIHHIAQGYNLIFMA